MPEPDLPGTDPLRVFLGPLLHVKFEAAVPQADRAGALIVHYLSPKNADLGSSSPVALNIAPVGCATTVSSSVTESPARPKKDIQDIDLSGVDPRRWPEIRRRIEAIKGYIALGRRDGAVRDRYAADLGLSPMTFLALVQAWKEHGQAVKLAGAGIDRRKPRSRRSLPEATRNAIHDAIAALGPTARHVDVVAEAHRRCSEIGTRRASDTMVQYLLMKARRDAAPAEGAPAILIGRVVCKLPVRKGQQVVLPDLVLAVMSPEGTIPAYALAAGEADAACLGQVLVDLAMKRTRGGQPRDLVIPPALYKIVASLGGIPSLRGPTTSRISHLLGAGIGRVDVAHRRKATTGPTNGDSPMNTPLTPEEAAAAVQLAIDLHNESRGGLASFDITEEALQASLAA